jgi:hypothetical protein
MRVGDPSTKDNGTSDDAAEAMSDVFETGLCKPAKRTAGGSPASTILSRSPTTNSVPPSIKYRN